MTQTLDEATLGRGLYTFSEAAQILRSKADNVTTRQLRYWLTTGLTPATYYDPTDNELILSFDDLISLEIVRRFRGRGASLQGLRRVEAILRDSYPTYERPFAHRVFFTDGADVWAETVGKDGRFVIQLTGRHRHQHAWTGAIQTFAKEITFEGETERASRWMLTPWVEVNPAIQFGTPVVTGSRVPVRTIEANLEAGTPEEVADWYGLRVEQVEGVRDYLALN